MKRYFGILMVLAIFLVTGCAAVLIGGAAAGGYAVATDERQSGRMMDDSTITTRINKAMIKDDLVKAHHIDVDTVDGHVTLSGLAKTDAELRRAVQIAKQEDGVKSVRNNLQVGEKTWGQSFNDKWMVSKIKSKLIAEPEIRSLNIDVDVHKGVVTLTGIVGNKYQKKRAIEVAKATEGTRRVVDNLKVK
jgi:hyperosmotically inducible protein